MILSRLEMGQEKNFFLNPAVVPKAVLACKSLKNN
jgi:hypothetical protein